MSARLDKPKHRETLLRTLAKGPLMHHQIIGRYGQGVTEALKQLRNSGCVTVIQSEYFLTGKGLEARKALDAR